MNESGSTRDTGNRDVWLFLALLVEERRLLLAVTLLILFGGYGAWLYTQGPPIYVASASFFPESDDRRTDQVAAIASSMGLGAGAPQGLDSPEFYIALVRSDNIISSVAKTPMRTTQGGGGSTATPIEALVQAGFLPNGVETQGALEWIRENLLEISPIRGTSIIEIEVAAPDPRLAAEMTEAFLAEIIRFNSEVRRSRARREREFIEGQLSEARAEAAAAETALQRFLEQNRELQNSPQLAFKKDRLERAWARRQQQVSSLIEGLDRARREEVREAATITIVDPPRVPAAPRRVPYLRMAALILLLALSGGMAAAYAQALLKMEAAREGSGLRRLEKAIGTAKGWPARFMSGWLK